MKSSNSLARRAAVLAASSLLLALAGCGQKGPLYMPKVPPDPLARTSPKPDAAKPGAAQDGGAASKPAAGNE
ncbi:lipoprotein [Herbaspirillum sp.]|uniref:LPS translocon maturation chaperone LptM n=1 Tax=Herbaspirillum sp. TaxID=1890675 RepID=UPI001B044D65|nr:lipoprotein [Herbaspirillum sp.]MBO9536750.1 lipoprotein [Herbaspirillum sp.]